VKITGIRALESRRGVRRAVGVVLLTLVAVLAACSDLLNPPLPAGTQDPSTFNNEAGAIARYKTAVADAWNGFVEYARTSGTFTDELHVAAVPPSGVVGDPFDERILSEFASIPFGNNAVNDSVARIYGALQHSRGADAEAIGALAKYAPNKPASLRAELYAYTAFSEIGLADLFCSGIPLSTLDFEGDFTYKAGSSTADVYRHAIALLDTARSLGADSAAIVNLAAVGTGRALLAIGEFANAAQAVANVPDDFRFEHLIHWQGTLLQIDGVAPLLAHVTVANGEGQTGLPFLASEDPRSASQQTGTSQTGQAIFTPSAYVGITPLVLASGVEARLIQAEAALQANDGSWLTMLNTLRTDGTFDTQPNADNPGQTDTLWHAGTGGVPGLAPLSDPQTANDDVDLLFRERAFWLFVTGHRQGDLRRLIRQYHRRQESVYPTGFYQGGLSAYGTDVTAPIPPQERLNPLFTGCLNRDP
jgi:starch-binding outer membrane protein, SusD/RagB family